MTTTSPLQLGPDFYTSLDECKQHKIEVGNNERYPLFRQTHWTAGDEDQFETYRGKQLFTQNDGDYDNIPESDLPSQLDFPRYSHLTDESVQHTFRYLFYKFKKGIFIQIRNNQVSVMLPFSNVNFMNEWHTYIELEPKYKTWNDLFKIVTEQEGYPFNEKRVNKYKNRWYANNALIRYEFPIQENDTGVCTISHMFQELCKHKKIPDVEFFVNRRDSPLLRHDLCESYDNMFGDNVPLVSHLYETYTPILSMNTTDAHADIPIPTWDDWARVCFDEGKYFPRMPNHYGQQMNLDWDSKIKTAMFRGSSTGYGTNVETNPRLKISSMSREQRKDRDGILFLNAGITKWNARLRKHKNNPYLQTLQKGNVTLVEWVSFSDQTNYKFIIHIDGHVSAFRLSMELASMSLVLKVDSNNKMWFSHLLKPFVHYIPIKSDLSDIYDAIKWCKANDLECYQIACNARLFAQTYLQKEGILTYLYNILCTIKKNGGDYVYTITEKPLSKEVELMASIPIPDEVTIPFVDASKVSSHLPRCFELCQALSWTVQHTHHETRMIHMSKKSTVEKMIHYPMIIKKSLVNSPFIHETFVGRMCMNTLMEILPNVMYTYPLSENGAYRGEYISSLSFSDFLVGEDFCMSDYLSILVQLLLTLHIAQERFQFVHYDMYPWNIMLIKTEETHISYIIKDTLIHVKARYIPVLVDYGQSHVVYEGESYGKYDFNSIFDVITVLVSSMCIVFTKQTVDKGIVTCIFKLLAWLNPSALTQHETIKTVKELKVFLSNAKKYAFLQQVDMSKTRFQTPLEVYSYLKECGLYKGIEYYRKLGEIPYTIVTRHGEAIYFYELLIHKSGAKERLIERLKDIFQGDATMNQVTYQHIHRIVTTLKLDIGLDWCKHLNQRPLKGADISIFYGRK